MDYRSISAYLRAFPEQRVKIGLDAAPSHTTIRNLIAKKGRTPIIKPQ